MAMLKICGVKDPGDLAWLDGSVDYIGFVYTARGGSARSIDPLKADSMASTLSKSKPVLVASGLSPEELADLASRLRYIKVVQIHDPRDPGRAGRLARLLWELGLSPAPVALWRGSWLVNPCSLEGATRAEGARVEYILVDRVKGYSPLPPSTVMEAGCVSRLGVAGGMTPGRVCSLPLTPFLIDASSWPERLPGAKDPGKVLELRRSVERCLP